MAQTTPSPMVDTPIRGIVLMVIAVGLWALHDAASKWLAVSYPIAVLLFWRSQFALVPMAALIHRAGGVRRLSPRLQLLCILRGVAGFASFSCFMFALPLMPFADAVAVGMAAPIFLTALSVPILKERVARRRWIAILAGFVAVLFIVRPSGSIPVTGALLLLTSNLLYAGAMMVTRRMARVVDTATMSFYGGISFALISAAAVTFFWVMPTWSDLGMLAAIGLMAGIAQYCMTDAFRTAAAAVIAPFEYTGIVWAVILGYVIWGELPGWDVAAGVAVIIMSSLFILHDENRTRRPS